MKTLHDGDAEVTFVGGVLVGVDATSEVVKTTVWHGGQLCVVYVATNFHDALLRFVVMHTVPLGGGAVDVDGCDGCCCRGWHRFDVRV